MLCTNHCNLRLTSSVLPVEDKYEVSSRAAHFFLLPNKCPPPSLLISLLSFREADGERARGHHMVSPRPTGLRSPTSRVNRPDLPRTLAVNPIHSITAIIHAVVPRTSEPYVSGANHAFLIQPERTVSLRGWLFPFLLTHRHFERYPTCICVL